MPGASYWRCIERLWAETPRYSHLPDPPLYCAPSWIRADIAQLVEHLIRNEGVGGSNPSVGTTNRLFLQLFLFFSTCAFALSADCRRV